MYTNMHIQCIVYIFYVVMYFEQIDVSCSIAYDLPVDERNYLLLKKLGLLLASLGNLLSSLWVSSYLFVTLFDSCVVACLLCLAIKLCSVV